MNTTKCDAIRLATLEYDREGDRFFGADEAGNTWDEERRRGECCLICGRPVISGLHCRALGQSCCDAHVVVVGELTRRSA
jgi:hypothetical protein